MCECSLFVAGDAASTLRPTARDPPRSITVQGEQTVASAFQNKSTIPKRDFSFTTKFHKSKTQKFLISTNTTSIICKKSATSTSEDVTAHPRLGFILIKDKEFSGATYYDAVTLAHYARLQPNTVGYNDFIKEAMA